MAQLAGEVSGQRMGGERFAHRGNLAFVQGGDTTLEMDIC
jgi:hypothetical protein